MSKFMRVMLVFGFVFSGSAYAGFPDDPDAVSAQIDTHSDFNRANAACISYLRRNPRGEVKEPNEACSRDDRGYWVGHAFMTQNSRRAFVACHRYLGRRGIEDGIAVSRQCSTDRLLEVFNPRNSRHASLRREFINCLDGLDRGSFERQGRPPSETKSEFCAAYSINPASSQSSNSSRHPTMQVTGRAGARGAYNSRRDRVIPPVEAATGAVGGAVGGAIEGARDGAARGARGASD